LMKNRKALFILVPLVVLVWGLIIRQVFSYRSDSADARPARVNVAQEPGADTSRYVLMANYRDPFLRYSVNTSVESSPSTRKRANNIKVVKTGSIKIPERPEGVIYRGIISSHDNRVGLLEIGEQRLLIREHSSIRDFMVLSMSKDSLKIEYHDKEFTYEKQ
jgi:hypothetical protein